MSPPLHRSTRPPRPRRPRDPKWWTLTAVCLGVFMLLLDITIVNVALPDIQTELDATLSDLQWVIDAYALSLAALLLTAGSLADLFGRRRVFVIGTVIFTLGSIACGSAQDILFLTISRAFQGIGGAAMFATALALLASAFHGKDRGTAFGVFGATTGVAVAIGPVLGGVLTSGLSWRWIFFVNIPICIVAITVSMLRVAESRDPTRGPPDWFGFVSFSLALGALVYGLIEAGQESWGEQKVVICLVAAAVLLVVFVVSQAMQRQPMFDLGLLAQADLHRRPDRGVRRLGVDLLAAHLPGDLRPERPRLLGRRDRRAIPVPLGCLVLRRRFRRPADGAGPGEVADRARLPDPRRRPPADPRDPGRLVVDPPDPRPARLRCRHRADQPSAGLDGRGRRTRGARRGWRAAPTPRCARSASPPASPRSARSSASRSPTPRVPGCPARSPSAALDGLTEALSGGQVHAAAQGAQQAATAAGGQSAGQQAFDLVTQVGTSRRRRPQPRHLDRRRHRVRAGSVQPGADPAARLRGPWWSADRAG